MAMTLIWRDDGEKRECRRWAWRLSASRPHSSSVTWLCLSHSWQVSERPSPKACLVHSQSSLLTIIAELFHELVHYFKYASSAYVPLCPRPNGKYLVSPVCPLVDAFKFAYKHDLACESIDGYPRIYCAWRRQEGTCSRAPRKVHNYVLSSSWYLTSFSVSVVDFLTDVEMVLVPFMVPMILPAPPDCEFLSPRNHNQWSQCYLAKTQVHSGFLME